MNQPSGSPASESTTTRRAFLARAAAFGITAATLGALEASPGLARSAAAAVDAAGRSASRTRSPGVFPDIQFDLADFIDPAFTIDGIAFRFAPIYILATTYVLRRTPDSHDRARLRSALTEIEDSFAFSPAGVFSEVSYGIPYLNRLNRHAVAEHLPRLREDPTRFALEEAVPGPTDVSALNPGVVKKTFNVPVTIEANDLLVQFRSDRMSAVHRASAILESRLGPILTVTSRRLTFTQPGAPRHVADVNALPYADLINRQAPMWMGFADQQVAGAGPAEICTFAGNPSAVVTTARSGDYFDTAAVRHQSHVIEDLAQFYANTATDTEPYTERCQYMFRSNPIPAEGRRNQYANGGGPAYIANTFHGPSDAVANANPANTYSREPRSGHLSNLQRSSRAADGTPMHIRADGPGFDAMDVPGGSMQPKLQFAIYVPSAEFFRVMRTNQANLDLVDKYHINPNDNGLERFITATRRQNFLVPPRRHRVFPLLEFHR